MSNERQIQRARSGTYERIERVAVDPRFVGDEQLLRRQVVRLIGRIAEEIVEERSDGSAEIRTACPREQRALPDDDGGDVNERVPCLARGEVFGSAPTELRGGGGVKQQWMRIRHRGAHITTAAAVASDIRPAAP